MPTQQTDRRKLQRKKCHGKQVVLKKAWELSRKCKLKVNVVVWDDETNVMQEFKSCSQFNSEAIALHK